MHVGACRSAPKGEQGVRDALQSGKAGAAGGDTSFTNTSAPRFSVAHAPTPSAPQTSALPGAHLSCCGVRQFLLTVGFFKTFSPGALLCVTPRESNPLRGARRKEAKELRAGGVTLAGPRD